MARSYRKYPVKSYCNAGTQKSWQQYQHGRERTWVRTNLACGNYEINYSPKDFGNEWASPRDGKSHVVIDQGVILLGYRKITKTAKYCRIDGKLHIDWEKCRPFYSEVYQWKYTYCKKNQKCKEMRK